MVTLVNVLIKMVFQLYEHTIGRKEGIVRSFSLLTHYEYAYLTLQLYFFFV